MNLIANLTHKYFPNALVLPALGNNDNYYHYQPDWGENAKSYYESYFKWFFIEHPANANLTVDEL